MCKNAGRACVPALVRLEADLTNVLPKELFLCLRNADVTHVLVCVEKLAMGGT